MASKVQYGLSSDGFKKKRLPEIISSLESNLETRLGLEIEKGANSIIGQTMQIVAYEIADLWEQLEATYNAMYPNTATGTSLANSAGLAGIAQITAKKTTTYITCLGDAGTAIPYGAYVSNSSQKVIFQCLEADAKISMSKANMCVLELDNDPAEGNVYEIVIDGNTYAYTAKEEDTKTNVLVGLGGLLSDYEATTENEVLTVKSTNMQDTFAISVEGLTVTQTGTPVRFECTKAGATDIGIGKLTNIMTSTEGWSAASNDVEAVVGCDAETDTALRQRWNVSVYDNSVGMCESIRAALLNVNGVNAALIYENVSDETDSNGRPPHSIEAIVDGGDDNDIAAAIWQRKAGGIDTYGSESVDTQDSQGVYHTMHFNRPIQTKIWLKIELTKNPEEALPAAAEREVLAAVLNKGNSFQIGQDVILQRFYSDIYKATTGIGYIKLTAASGDTAEEYSDENIVIDVRHLAVFDGSRITVVVNDEQS